MYSRAHILIQKEIAEAESDEKTIITKVNDENVFELTVLIEGLPNTSWENGSFQVYMKFNENYNFEPPCVYFQTIPYHPNIDMITGRPSIDFLDDKYKWRQDFSIKHILQTIQNLLAYPLLDRAVNMDAVFMLKGNPIQYESIVRQSVIATQRIRQNWNQRLTNRSDTESQSMMSETREDIITQPTTAAQQYAADNYDIDLVKYFENEHSEPEVAKNNKYFRKYPLFTIKKENQKEKTKENVKNSAKNSAKSTYKKWTESNASIDGHLKNISFDDYCTLWKGIATSKASKNDENVYLKNGLLENPKLLSQHLSISIKELEEQVYQQLNEHKNIMYGKFEFTNRTMDLKPFERDILNSKAQYTHFDESDLNNLGAVYLSRHASATAPQPSLKHASSKNVDGLLSNSQPLQSRQSNTKIEFDQVNGDFDEHEVDELLNWTKNIG